MNLNLIVAFNFKFTKFCGCFDFDCRESVCFAATPFVCQKTFKITQSGCIKLLLNHYSLPLYVKTYACRSTSLCLEHFLRPAAKCKSAAISKPANLSCYEFWWIQTGIWLHNLMITWPYQSQIPFLNQHAGPQLHESLLQWNIQKCKLTQMHLPSLVVIPFPAKFQPRWPWNHTWRSFLGFGPGSGHLGEAWGLI